MRQSKWTWMVFGLLTALISSAMFRTLAGRCGHKTIESSRQAHSEKSVIVQTVPARAENDIFAGSVRQSEPTIKILSSIEGAGWCEDAAIYPVKGQKVVLKVEQTAGADIRWRQIVPDISRTYKNANFPWDEKPYQWIGFARIDYQTAELTQFRGRWQIEPFDNKENGGRGQDRAPGSGFRHSNVGSFWFQAEVAKSGTVYRSPGVEDSDERGLSPAVFRVSIRDGQGYIGYLTSFFNVPGVFGSTTYQSVNYIGVDCADVLMAAYGKWRHKTIERNYNVAMLVNELPKVREFEISSGNPNIKLSWGRDILVGDFIGVRYAGSRQYQHIGAIFDDGNKNGILDGEDVIIHAGPAPLHYSRLREGNFDGHAVILRP